MFFHFDPILTNCPFTMLSLLLGDGFPFVRGTPVDYACIVSEVLRLERLLSRMNFASEPPTFLHSHKNDFPLPVPRLIFQGLESAWNAFSHVALDSEVAAMAEDYLKITKLEDLKTSRVSFSTSTRKGFTGLVTLGFANRPSNDFKRSELVGHGPMWIRTDWQQRSCCQSVSLRPSTERAAVAVRVPIGHQLDTGDAGWPGLFTITVQPFTFTTDACGAGSWHVNLRADDLNAGSNNLSVWVK